jgi:hypothetical protein
MKKSSANKKQTATSSKARSKIKDIFSKTFGTGEKATDTARLDRDVPEEFRAPLSNELPASEPNRTNWSEPEDRGEDLINERDPFTQQPERDTEVPPELIQERAYQLYEQRGGNPGDNLSDWFEAERQLRGEMVSRKKDNKRRGYSSAKRPAK